MKSKRIFLFVLNFVIVSLLYRADFVVAMAASQNLEDAGGFEEEEGDKPAPGPEAEEGGESVPGPKEEEGDKPAGVPEEGEGGEPVPGPEEEKGGEPAPGPGEGEGGESAGGPKAEEGGEPAPGSEAGEGNKPVPGPEAGENGEFTADGEAQGVAEPAAGEEAEGTAEPAPGPESGDASADDSSEPAESVATGTALSEWLEAHKNTGGTVKLTDNIVWDEEYCFCPNGINMPTVFVDAGRYTVTVTGQIELLSDYHLRFSGQPDGKSLFQVAGNGVLSMEGIAVESGNFALWQEEGAGLVISDCHVSGNIRYADTPFVMYYRDNICAVVEKGQTIDEALPSQLNCTVNRQGELSHDERIPVLWNLEGTEKQQEERRRFRLQGSFVDAASAEPASCTVVYDDYPLTFTDVKASARGCLYTFQGGFTIREEYLPLTIKAEYSFDGANWLLYEEQSVTCADASFYIACKDERRNGESVSNIYIRLQHEDDGTTYFSNVLCYAADNMDSEEDIGGSRGGGTSITNPPDEPGEEVGGAPSEEEPGKEPGNDADSENAAPEIPPAADQEESGDRDSQKVSSGSGSGETSSDTNESGNNPGRMPQAEPFNSEAGRPTAAEVSETEADQALQADSPDTEAEDASTAKPANNQTGASSERGTERPLFAEAEAGDTQNAGESAPAVAGNEEAVEAISAYGESFTHMGEHARTDGRQVYYMAIATAFVLLSAIAGAAGFYAHSRYSRSGTKR